MVCSETAPAGSDASVLLELPELAELAVAECAPPAVRWTIT
jgi:hypothetical protein